MDQDSFLSGIEILDTTLATSSTASIYTHGGIAIYSTSDSIDFNNGGSFLTLGGASISKSLNIGGNTSLFSTTVSINTSTGSIIIKGGMGIQGNVYGNFASFTSSCIANLIATNSTYVNLMSSNFTTSTLVTGNLTSQTINITGTTNSISTTTGTLIISGGIGVKQSIFANRGYYGDMSSVTNNSRPINLVDTNAAISCWRWVPPNGANVGNPAIELIAGTSGNAGDCANNWWDTYLDDSDAWVIRRRTGGDNTPYMAICSNGNVGIGGSSAANLTAYCPLTVTGNAAITSNLTVGISILTTNFLTTNARSTNNIISNLSVGSVINTNNNTTNFTCVNSIITTETIGSILATNINVTNITSSRLIINTLTSLNTILTNVTLANLSATNETVTNAIITNLNSTLITANNLLLSGNTQNTLYIDTQSSQTNPAQLIFKNSSSIGDYRIAGDGGDLQLQGGACRALQIASSNEIRLIGGRISTGNVSFINGANSVYNTIIQNSNDSIALTIQSNNIQTSDLTVWTNNSGIILSKIDKLGHVYINSTVNSTNSSTASIVTFGGVSIAKSINIAGTQSATCNSDGTLNVIGGVGIGSNIYIGSTVNSTNSTSISAITTLGGVSVGKDMYVGGTLNSINEKITYSTISNLYVGTLSGNAVYTNYNYVGVASTSSITSTTGTLKASLTTGTLIAGVYAIDIGYSIAPTTSTTSLSEVGVYLNSTSSTGFGNSTGSTLIHNNILQPYQTTLLTPYFTSITQTFGNTINALGLYYRAKTNGNTIAIGNVSIRLYRIQ